MSCVGAAARSPVLSASRAPVKHKRSLSIGEGEASNNGAEDEADNYTMTRMLEDGDGTGRLLYVGDSSTLSFLQLLRMIVETTAGLNSFSSDPSRHQITETQFHITRYANFTHALPNKAASLILVDSFFVNTHGMIDVFEEKTFLTTVDKYYLEPLSIECTWLCLFNLVLAIGLCLATPRPGSTEAAVVYDMRSKHPNQSEIFFMTAKNLSNSLAGLEEACLWSIQVLTLMAFYMLTHSKRNTAYVYAGMAVRSAYALGIHREETLVIFAPDERSSRRKLWRSLFVLDRFLAVSLGRPVAIAEEESSGEILQPPDHASGNGTEPDGFDICAAGLAASVRSCHLMGTILRRVYHRRKISVKQAQILADEYKKWPENLSPSLHWKEASSRNIRQAIAILHCNLAYCHSVILLTRPFFLYLLSIEVQRSQLHSAVAGPNRQAKMEKFSEACMIASIHTVALCHNAHQGGYLPRLNPFPTYSMFSAALIISANEFARPTTNLVAAQSVHNAIDILHYCAETDPQAKRAAFILENFRDVIQTRSHLNMLDVNSTLQSQPPTNTSFTSPPLTNNQELPPLTAPFDNPPNAPMAGPLASLAGPSSLVFSNPSDDHSNLLSPGQLPEEYSFSGLLDLENTVLPIGDEGSHSSVDEDFEFDSFWDWPAGFSANAP